MNISPRRPNETELGFEKRKFDHLRAFAAYAGSPQNSSGITHFFDFQKKEIGYVINERNSGRPFTVVICTKPIFWSKESFATLVLKDF